MIIPFDRHHAGAVANLFLANSTIMPLPAFGITLDNALASNRN